MRWRTRRRGKRGTDEEEDARPEGGKVEVLPALVGRVERARPEVALVLADLCAIRRERAQASWERGSEGWGLVRVFWSSGWRRGVESERAGRRRL